MIGLKLYKRFFSKISSFFETEKEFRLSSPFDSYIRVTPIPSNTIPPFTTTNFVSIHFENTKTILFVDPGASSAGKESFRKKLKEYSIPSSYVIKTFLTHHHLDHVEGLDVISSLFPQSTLISDKRTFNRIKIIPANLKIENVSNLEKISFGEENFLQVLATPGHTDSHLSLWNPHDGLLIGGDHVAGKGSISLDSSCGDMLDYFQTTKSLLQLNLNLLIPAHGPPVTNPKEVLQFYLKHRQAREDSILDSVINKGSETMEMILKLSYSDVDPSMFPAAINNIKLHLKKLWKEKKISDDIYKKLVQ